MAKREMRLRANRWLLLGARSCGLAVAAGIPTITEFWSEKGLSKADFYLLEIVFALALIIFEVAMGRFADIFGKALTLRLGFSCQVLGSLSYAWSHTFADFLVGELLFALGIALNSGADEGLLFQSGKALGESGTQNRWWSVINSTGFVFMALAALIGGYLATYDLSYPYLFSAGFQVLALGAACFIIEPPLEMSVGETKTRRAVGAATKLLLFSDMQVRWMVLAPGFVMAINQTYLWMYKDYLTDCSMTIAQVGYLFAFFHIVAGASAFALRSVKEVSTSVIVLFVTLLGLMASTTGMIATVAVWAWILLIPQQMARSLTGVLFSEAINNAVPDQFRVTALSVRNAIRILLYIAAMIPWYLGVNDLGRSGMFAVNLLLIVLGFLILWSTRPRMFKATLSDSTCVVSE
jgi:MFS family permease